MNRPTSVTVFGILNLVFAAFGFIAIIFTALLFIMPQPANSPNPVIQLIHDNSTYAAWMVISAGLGVLSSIALLASGIGLLKMRAWARTLSIVYAIYAIIMIVVGTAVNYVFLVQPLLAQSQNQSGPQAAAAISGTIGGCFGAIYPILLLIFMLLPKVANSLRPPPLPQS